MAITLDGTSGITSPALDSTGTTTISTNNVALRLKDSSGSLYEAIKATSSNQLQLSSGGASSSYLFYANAGTLKLRIDNDGLKFNGDTAAANALDDYEEGTWTAQIIGSTTNPSTAVTMPTATYTKIGRLVFAQFQFSNVDTTGASGGVRVSGLPFASAAAHATGNVMTYVRMTFPTTSTNISPYVSGTDMSFYTSTSNQGWAEITHNAGTGAYLAATVTYQTNA